MSELKLEENDADIATDFSLDTELLDINHLRTAVANAGSPTPLLSKALRQASEVLHSRYLSLIHI